MVVVEAKHRKRFFCVVLPVVLLLMVVRGWLVGDIWRAGGSQRKHRALEQNQDDEEQQSPLWESLSEAGRAV